MNEKTDKPVVIVIDDDPEWRGFVSRELGDRCEVRSADNGPEGLKMVRRTKPAAVILDIMMGSQTDGFATFKELRQDADTQRIPVVMFSEINRQMALSFSPAIIGQYLGETPEAFLEKPVTGEHLRRTIARILGAKSRAKKSSPAEE